jgi:signal transduction histidine kinase/ActR/RegA family two-component response regulator
MQTTTSLLASSDFAAILYLLGADGKIRWISDNLHDLTGLNAVQVLGKSVSDIIQIERELDFANSNMRQRIGTIAISNGIRAQVLIAESRGSGLPGFGTLSLIADSVDRSALRALLGQVMLWQLDLQLMRARASGYLAETIGYGYEDSSDLDWMDLVHPEDQPIYQMQFAAIARGEIKSLEVEARLRRKEGWVWTLTRGEVSDHDDTGFPTDMSGFTLDITRHKQVESELQAHRALLRRSLRLARVAAWSYDAQQTQQTWTDEASELLGVPTGYVPDNLLGLELFDGESQVRVNKAVTRALNEGIGFDQELLRITPQGRVMWIRAVANPEFEDGVMVRLSGLFQDITRQRRMEQAVRDSERLLRQLTASLPDAIFQIRRNADGQYFFDFLSDGIRRMLEITTDTLPDFAGLQTAMEPESRAQFARSLDRAASTRELWIQEVRVESQSGPNRVLLGRAQPEPQLDGSCLYFGFFADVTEQRRQEIALRDAEQTQQRLTRLEAVGQLAGGIAHDFNNYLTSIVMSLSLLEAQPELSNDAIQLVREALSATSSAQALTRQLLTFSRGAAPVKQIVDTESLIREAVTFTLRGSAVQCSVQTTEVIWPVEVDAGQIQQVLQNLVLNAAQAMNNQGQMQIRISNLRAGQAASVAGLANGPAIRIEVIDAGSGVTDAVREKLFQPYVTSKEYGSGLGLASAFSIVRRHEGMITYEPNPNGGAIFSVWLPAPPKRVPSIDGAPLGMVKGYGKVLVMDDNEGILKMLRRALEHLGFEALTAHDGVEAVQVMEQARIDGAKLRAVILDQTIPGGVGGVEALKMLRANEPNIIAIATSGYTEGETMANFAEFGFAGILRKPFRVQDLAKVLADVLPSGKSS